MLVAPNKKVAPSNKQQQASSSLENKQHSQEQKKFNKQQHLFKSYEISRFMSLTYTGGRVNKSRSEKFFVCCADKTANVIDYENGQVLSELKGDEFIISTAISPDDKHLVMGCRSLNIIIWSLATGKELRVIKGNHPVLEMDYDPTGTLVAMGCSDGSIKIYDTDNHYYTHNFTKKHTGKIQMVKFHPMKGKLLLFTSALDGLRVWDLFSRKCVAILNDHSSVVTDICFVDADGERMVTSSRDNVLNVYHVTNEAVTKVKTIPVFESVESLALVPNTIQYATPTSSHSQQIVMTAGETGILRVYDIEAGECIFTQPDEEIKTAYSQMKLWTTKNQAMCVSADGNFLFFDVQTLMRTKQILGFNDEILDIKVFGKNQPRMAVCTTNSRIIVFDVQSKNTQFLLGHTDIVLTLDASKDTRFLVSGSKDHSVRVWDLYKMRCIGVGSTHTASVSAVAMAPKTGDFFVSCSDDKTMKLWTMDAVRQFAQNTVKKAKNKDLEEKDLMSIPCAVTVSAHNKDISDVSISPDEQFIATCSADRTAKLWSREKLECLQTFKHKMGVWSVAFSPVEKCLVTGCSDNVIRIWSLKTGAILKTFEGHESAVLRVGFVNLGLQLFSTASDGIAKLWTIKTGECVETFDVHKDRVWALSINKDGGEIVTGGEDCRINIWRENTNEVIEDQRKALDDTVVKDQHLQNLLKQNKMHEAISLAISLDRPLQVYGFLQKLFETTKESEIRTIVKKLTYDEVMSLFQYTVDWNTNSRYSTIAHRVLDAMFKSLDPNFVPWSYEKSVDSILAYSERHFKRVESLLQQSYLLDFTLQHMKVVAPTLQQENTPTDVEMLDRKPLQDPELLSANEEHKVVHEQIRASMMQVEEVENGMEDVETEPQAPVNGFAKQIPAQQQKVDAMEQDNDEDAAIPEPEQGKSKSTPKKKGNTHAVAAQQATEKSQQDKTPNKKRKPDSNLARLKKKIKQSK